MIAQGPRISERESSSVPCSKRVNQRNKKKVPKVDDRELVAVKQQKPQAFGRFVKQHDACKGWETTCCQRADGVNLE
jgi:hypothetical protein